MIVQIINAGGKPILIVYGPRKERLSPGKSRTIRAPVIEVREISEADHQQSPKQEQSNG